MLKFIASLVERLVDDADQTETDPLLHPALRCMSQRELADLPFGQAAKRKAEQNACPA